VGVFGDKRFKGHTEDIPYGLGQLYIQRDMNALLPRVLYGTYELIAFEPKGIELDPVVLRNKWNQIIYQWPDDYIPDWVDVLTVCTRLGL